MKNIKKQLFFFGFILFAFAGNTYACPSCQYESCIFGACVCLPKVPCGSVRGGIPPHFESVNVCVNLVETWCSYGSCSQSRVQQYCGATQAEAFSRCNRAKSQYQSNNPRTIYGCG